MKIDRDLVLELVGGFIVHVSFVLGFAVLAGLVLLTVAEPIETNPTVQPPRVYACECDEVP